jgi:hypothetical protein
MLPFGEVYGFVAKDQIIFNIIHLTGNKRIIKILKK